jgi:choline kinase
MKAIILAAGMGQRLGPVAIERPKCLLKLRGETIVSRQLKLLAAHGVSDVTIVTGHLGEKIRAALGDRVSYAVYPDYAGTNNLMTLHHCRDLLEGDALILFSDVLTEARAIGRCIASPHDFALLVDLGVNRPDTMRVKRTNGLIADIGSHISVPEGDGNFIGIAKFSAAGTQRLRQELQDMVRERGFEGAYYTQALPRLASAGCSVNAVPLDGARWFEIDSQADYESALEETFYDD